MYLDNLFSFKLCLTLLKKNNNNKTAILEYVLINLHQKVFDQLCIREITSMTAYCGLFFMLVFALSLILSWSGLKF